MINPIWAPAIGLAGGLVGLLWWAARSTRAAKRASRGSLDEWANNRIGRNMGLLAMVVLVLLAAAILLASGG